MSEKMHLSGPAMRPASGGKAKQLIVLLHGLGADGEDLFGLTRELAPSFPNACFISPNAPYRCDMAPYGYQWFSMLDRNPSVMYEGMLLAAPILNAFLDEALEDLELKPNKLAVIGYSQGSMMALHVAPRRAVPIAGVVGLSGGVMSAEHLGKEIQSRPPICLIHGDADQVVPYSLMGASEKILKSLDVPVVTHTRAGLGHGIDTEGLELTIAFLKQVLV